MIIYLILLVVLVALFSIFILQQQKTAMGNTIDRGVSLYLFSGGNTTLHRYITGDKFEVNSFPPQINPRLFVNIFTCGTWNSNNSSVKLAIPYIKYKVRSYLRSTIDYDNKFKNSIVIHLRCSDVPFIRAQDYHLYTHKSYTNAINFALSRNPDLSQVIILNSTSHCFDINRSRVCIGIAESLRDYIKDNLKIPISILGKESSDLDRDIRMMLSAGCLIGFVGSFVYYIGVAKTRGIFVSTQKSIADHMFSVNTCKIPHSKVRNYYDTVDVIRLLTEK